MIEFNNGKRIQIGYADQNGHPYRSMGRALIRAGELQRGKFLCRVLKNGQKIIKRN